MMTASPNDVCLRAHKGKHRIIASETSNIILSEAKNIISPQAIHHCSFRPQFPAKALQSPRFYAILNTERRWENEVVKNNIQKEKS